ncbi:MAG: T9SS type A sorting domain-containing protein, partial [Bacteroidales bacterium]|nr:T9SS type A sorting domain-containing protein [Bacteroidales bacterium]
RMAMDFLTRLQSNPSYELQLSYGTIAAARMNAVEGTNYLVQKLLDWCFNRGDLRGWGSIVGKWGDYDVSGLIGEANDEGDDYAFVMNGFQQAAALAPLPKYDKRYARALAKWILNVTNASRLFYRNALPESLQDSYTWSSEYDPKACIPHESMKEVKQGKSPFATGDAIGGGWAATNLSLYSGSSVGYLAGVADTTNIPGILRIDLNKTDFYGDNSLISYLYFNPLTETKQVIVDLPSGASGIYDAITESVLAASASGSFQLHIPPGEVRLIRLFTASSVPEALNGRLYAGNAVLDYHYRYDFSADLRIKSLATDRNPIAKNTLFTAYCEPENIPSGETVQFEWFLDEALLSGKNQTTVQLTAPTLPGQAVLKCRISAGSLVAEDTIHLQIVDRIAVPPVVNGIQPAFKFTVTGGTNTFTALTEPARDEILEYKWSASSGSFSQASGNTATWQATVTPGVSKITVTVTNQDQLSTAVSVDALVKDTSLAVQSPLIWYPFDINDRNAAANRCHATASGVTKTHDARGNASMAYQFSSGQDIIYTENADDLNFSNAVSLSCWVKCGQLGSERFIISHGSWQQRYKLSITPEGFLRWTVKANTGVADLDGSFPIELNRYYHIAALYTGYSMELYIDGILDTYKAFSGAIQTSTKPITIGRMDNNETLYSLRGSVDEVKLWDREIPLKQIEQLKNQWYTAVQDTTGDPVSRLYPNPVHEVLIIGFTNAIEIESITLFDSEGRKVFENLPSVRLSEFRIDIPKTFSGVYVLRIFFKDGRIAKRKIVVAD